MSVTRNARRIAETAVASGVLAVGAVALAGSASASTTSASTTSASTIGARHTSYSFQTLDNGRDLTFNQLLGINDEGVIAGYFGSGAAGHPNRGYLLLPDGHYINKNFPHSAQTQVTGLNNRGVTVGFFSGTDLGGGMDANYGWVNVGGHFRQVDFPAASPASTPTDQNLGVNDEGIVVGFYNDANGNSHGYEYDIWTRQFSTVVDPSAPGASLTAAAINDRGHVAGFYVNPSNGNTDGFLLSHGHFKDLAVPGASSTTALGVNNNDEVVGTYTVGSGSSAVMHGFTWTRGHGFSTVDDPDGIGATTINGVNDVGQLVGFYTDGNGNTDGFLATP
jgi:hypothetical protein